MLVLTLRPGESLLADGEFELFFLGNGEDRYPQFELKVLSDRTYVVGMPGGALTARHVYRNEPERFTGQYGGYVRVGQSVIKLNVKSRERIKLAVHAPESVRFTRPAKHGGALVAR